MQWATEDRPSTFLLLDNYQNFLLFNFWMFFFFSTFFPWLIYFFCSFEKLIFNCSAHANYFYEKQIKKDSTDLWHVLIACFGFQYVFWRFSIGMVWHWILNYLINWLIFLFRYFFQTILTKLKSTKQRNDNERANSKLAIQSP